jgi:CheY-like chemotaxis protein
MDRERCPASILRVLHMSFDDRTILLVEDNEDDSFIFSRAYRIARLPHPVQVATDGKEALDYLFGEGAYSDRAKYPLPFLVFLDLKLPLKPGHEVLQAIRSSPALADLCVIVLTSSAEARDVTRAHELGAWAFLVKPPSAQNLASAVRAVTSWMASPGTVAERIPGDMFSPALFTGGQSPE